MVKSYASSPKGTDDANRTSAAVPYGELCLISDASRTAQWQGKPNPKRVPLVVVAQVLRLYRDRYHDLNVRHCHEKLRDQHRIELSCGWVSRRCRAPGWWGAGASEGCIANGGRGGPCPGCCCTSMAAASSVAGRARVRPDRDSTGRHQRD